MTDAAAILTSALNRLRRPPAHLLVGALAGWQRLLRRPPVAARMAPRLLVLALEPELGALMAVTPLFPALRAAYPKAFIEVMGRPMLAELLRHDASVDKVTVIADPGRSLIRTLRQGLAALAAAGERYDWLITTEGSRHWPLQGLYAFCLPADRRSGHGSRVARRWYQAPVPFDRNASIIENNWRALAPFGITAPPGEPVLTPGPDDRLRMRRLLADRGCSAERPFAVYVAETSNNYPTAWFPERMAAVADDLARRHGLQPVFVGTAAGQEDISGIIARMRAPAHNLAGSTTVSELAALMAMADLVVSLDTGALHVALTAATPLVVIASAWQSSHHWLPAASLRRIVLSERTLDCAPCYQLACAHRSCMAAITIAQVIAAADRLLAESLETRRLTKVKVGLPRQD